jgi:uncharacterized protein YndB with AHSA1/START domain
MPDVQILPSPPDHVLIQADFSNTTPQQVFEYFIKPDLLSKWWPQQAEVDARPSGAYHLSWPGMNWHLRGVYREFVPGEKLTFTWKWDHEPQLPERTVEVIFAPISEGTRVTIRHGTYDSSPADKDDRQSHIDGWIHFLAQLQKTLTG